MSSARSLTAAKKAALLAKAQIHKTDARNCLGTTRHQSRRGTTVFKIQIQIGNGRSTKSPGVIAEAEGCHAINTRTTHDC